MSDDPNITHIRLRNWARWASDKPLPDLTARISAIYSWAVAHTWSSGWGDDSPGDGIIPIYEQDAEVIDKAIRSLHLRHRTILLRQYLHLYRVDQMQADAAVRALDDILQGV